MKRRPRKWVARIQTSSLVVPPGTFTSEDPNAIARAVKVAAERGPSRRAAPYASAMSYLCFYLNRGGGTLSVKRRRTVERAKKELRRLFERG
jgi:hypothetical protein